MSLLRFDLLLLLLLPPRPCLCSRPGRGSTPHAGTLECNWLPCTWERLYLQSQLTPSRASSRTRDQMANKLHFHAVPPFSFETVCDHSQPCSSVP